MQKLRNLVCATLLTFIFTAAAFAGDMQTPGKTDPPPPPDGQHFSIPVGEADNPGQDDGTDVLADLLIEALLTVF